MTVEHQNHMVGYDVDTVLEEARQIVGDRIGSRLGDDRAALGNRRWQLRECGAGSAGYCEQAENKKTQEAGNIAVPFS